MQHVFCTQFLQTISSLMGSVRAGHVFLHFCSQVFAALDTMEYLRRSGRVPPAVAALGGLLSIKPLIELIDGEVKAISAVRTTHQVNERMFNLLLEGGGMERLAILHTSAEARAKGLLDLLMQKAGQLAPRDILTVNVTAVIGTHIGPNGLGFAVVMM
jgi:DegV family protein with EDD domain